MPILITTGQVGRILGLTSQRICALARDGRLPVHSHTPGGLRRFDLAVIQRIADERNAAKAASAT